MRLIRNIAFVAFALLVAAGAHLEAFDDPRDAFVDEWSQTCDDFLDMDGYPSIDLEMYGGCYCASQGCTETANGDFCSPAEDMCTDYCNTYFNGVWPGEWWCEGEPTYNNSVLFHCLCKIV